MNCLFQHSAAGIEVYYWMLELLTGTSATFMKVEFSRTLHPVVTFLSDVAVFIFSLAWRLITGFESADCLNSAEAFWA